MVLKRLTAAVGASNYYSILLACLFWKDGEFYKKICILFAFGFVCHRLAYQISAQQHLTAVTRHLTLPTLLTPLITLLDSSVYSQ